MAKMSKTAIKPSLKNPFAPSETLEFTIPGEIPGKKGGYEEAMQAGHDLIQRPIKSISIAQIEKQHFKKRMTVWERIRVLTENEPNVLFLGIANGSGDAAPVRVRAGDGGFHQRRIGDRARDLLGSSIARRALNVARLPGTNSA
jgi:hypothetical protein